MVATNSVVQSNIIDYLEKMKLQDDVKHTLELILRFLHPNEFRTPKQIRIDYRVLTHKNISEEELNKHLSDLVANCFNGQIYAVNLKGHYKHLF